MDDGSQNALVHCTKELPTMQLLYVDESDDDPFRDEESGADDDDDDIESEIDECDNEDS